MIRIAIVDDELSTIEAYRNNINEWRNIKCSLEARNGAELLLKLSKMPAQDLPHIILIDLSMPVMDGPSSIPKIRENYPNIRIIVVTTKDSPSTIIKTFKLDIAAYIIKGTRLDEVQRIIRWVMTHDTHYDENVIKILQNHLRIYKDVKDDFYSPKDAKLAPNEITVLRLICAEYTTIEISSILHRSPRTIDGSRNRLMHKTNARNVAGLVIYALKHQIIDLDDYNSLLNRPPDSDD